jgi:hypothetical protein
VEQLHPQDGDRGADGTELDALHQGPVIGDHPDRLVQVDVVACGDLRLIAEPGPGDMEEADDACSGAGDHVPREAAEGVAARAAGVHDCRDARPDAGQVGVDPVLVYAVVDVGVQVDQPGNDQLSGDVDGTVGVSGLYRRVDPGDGPVLDRHVQPFSQAARGVDHLAAL